MPGKTAIKQLFCSPKRRDYKKRKRSPTPKKYKMKRESKNMVSMSVSRNIFKSIQRTTNSHIQDINNIFTKLQSSSYGSWDNTYNRQLRNWTFRTYITRHKFHRFSSNRYTGDNTSFHSTSIDTIYNTVFWYSDNSNTS